MHVGKRIAELRRKQGLTQEQLGQLLGTTRQAVSKWESGKSNPDLDYVIHMGTLFRVSMDELLLGVQPNTVHAQYIETEETRKPDLSPKRRISFYVLAIVGILILLLCPLFATVYRNYLSGYEPAATDPYIYLQKWPLLGVKLAGILSSAIGMGGLAWPIVRKLGTDMVAVWREQ